MTYGEAHTKIKLSLRMEKGIWVHDEKPKHKPRMNEEDAALYYTNKFRTHYGLEQKEHSSFGAFKLVSPRKIRKGLKLEPTMRDFDKPEHYHDYYEALKLSKKIA